MKIVYSGFSLLELVVVMALVLVVLLFVVPAQDYFFNQSKNEVVRAQLLRAIALARSEALAQNEMMVLCSSADGKTCGGGWEQGQIIVTADKTVRAFQGVDVKGKIYWRAFPNHKTTVEFLPSGMLNNENGTFWYCEKPGGTASWSIVVNALGRARLELPTGPLGTVGTVSC